MRRPSQARLWTLALAGSLALHGLAAVALAALPARRDSPPPPTRISVETSNPAEAAGIAPAETVAPLPAEALAPAQAPTPPAAPAQTTSPVLEASANTPVAASPSIEAPATASEPDASPVPPVEEQAGPASQAEPASTIEPVADDREAPLDAAASVDPLAAAPPEAAPVQAVAEEAAPSSDAPPASAVEPVTDNERAVSAATDDSISPVAQNQAAPVSQVAASEPLLSRPDEPVEAPRSEAEVVVALAPEAALPAATVPLIEAPSSPPATEAPAVASLAPSPEVAPAGPDSPTAAPVAANVVASATTAEPVMTAVETPTVVAGVAQEEVAPVALAPVEDAPEEQTVAPVAAPEPEAQTQVAAALPRPASPASSTGSASDAALQLSAFLKGYEGGNCVLALPAGEDGVETFSDSQDKAERLRAAYERTTGVDVGIAPRQVSAGQCGTLAFSRSLAQYPNYPLKLRLDATTIDSGKPLAGKIEGVRKNTLYLMVVDDEGKTRLVKSYQGVTKLTVPFSEPMVLKNRNDAPVQLLVAIASDGPLDALDTPDGVLADGFFDDLAWEIVSEGHSIMFGIAGFVVR